VFNLYRKNAGGTGDDELILKTASNKLVNDWTADGRFLLYQEDSAQTKTDLWMMPMSGDRKPMRILGTPFSESEATVSPDGRWMAYTSDESAGRQVYVQTFPPSGRKWKISNSRAAAHPRWRSDGKQLFFDSSGTLTVVDIQPSPQGGEFRPGVPLGLFQGLVNITPHNFDVADLGRRFLVVTSPQSTLQGVPPIVVTVNWTSGLPVAR
jgi:eukaryotic-like serine/threonine-protein kinase